MPVQAEVVSCLDWLLLSSSCPPLDLKQMHDIFPQDAMDAKMKEIKAWLKERKVDDLERVSLNADQLDKVRIIP